MTPKREIDRIERLVEEGEGERALQASESLVRRFPDLPAALVCRAEVCHALDLPRPGAEAAGAALDRLDAAHREDRELRLRALHVLAWAQWQCWEFEAAEQNLRELLSLAGDHAAGWDLLAHLLEQTGRSSEAAAAARRAEQLDPELFPVPVTFGTEQVEEAIRTALAQLPEDLRALADEIPIVVQDFPTREMAMPPSPEEPPLPPDILGLFVGESRLERSYLNPLSAPGTIFLFKRNLERFCADRESLAEEITVTLHHELAHCWGFEERHMGELGLE
jgi:predicted Zn-dependent protease with MMP-like domain